MTRWFAFAAMAAAAGCATVGEEPVGDVRSWEDDSAVEETEGRGEASDRDFESLARAEERAESERDGTTDAAMAVSATVAREVEVPHTAGWLGDVLEAEYAGVSASVALRQVTRGRPLRLDVGGLDPLVGSQPGAVTVQDHVTSICAQADWACNAVGGVLVVSDMETQTLQVGVQPGASTASLKKRALSSEEDEAGGGEDDETGVEVSFSPYVDEVVGLVETVLGLAGEEEESGDDEGAMSLVDPRTGVRVLPSANAVVVTARPHMMRAVERELERFNAAAAQTVRLHIAVYEVSSRDGAERGVDLLALRDAAVGFGLRVEAGSTLGSGAVARLDFLEGNRTHGSRAVLRWLESAGSTRVTLNEVLEVRNNQVASVDATETRQFVAQISQGAAAIAAVFEVGPPEVLWKELRLGWSVGLQPTVVGDQVTVRVALSRRTLIEERPYSFADGAVEGVTFLTDDLNRMMSVTLRSGETKLLTSWGNTTSRRTETGVPWLGWFGRGGRDEEREHEVVLLMGAEVL